MKKLLIILLAIFFIIGCQSSTQNEISGEGTLTPENTEYDFGVIAMDQGVVSTKFTLTNTSQSDIHVLQMFTSCMCTSAKLITDKKESQLVGMPGHGIEDTMTIKIKPGESAEVEAIFDPNAHGPMGTGLNRRSVILKTDSTKTPEIKLNFVADVVSSSSELPVEEVSIFEFEETEHDFGIIKQSEGIVSKDFKFKYNGKEDIEITALPASCACTTAETDAKKLSSGDEGTITVYFDANLHVDPEGKFFKTVAIMTEPKLNVLPELKIWAEIDLDLGAEFYKLQNHQN